MEATLDRLAALLPEAAEALRARGESLREVRLRAGQPVRLCAGAEEIPAGGNLEAERLQHILAALMDYSLHAREEELRQGFFTLRDGCRVGVCGQLVAGEGRVLALRCVGSLCVRIARPIPGCADALRPWFMGPRSLLLAAPPGMGKTTLLRDIARQLSLSGVSVGVADERHELAACIGGVPSADLGPRADVMDGGPKAAAIRMLLRSMAPGAIVTDEIGGAEDAGALSDARRCGAAVIASAHAGDMAALLHRKHVSEMLRDGLFDAVALLGDAPGRVRAVYCREEGGTAWGLESSWRA